MFSVILVTSLMFSDCKNGVCTADRAGVKIFNKVKERKKSERTKRFKRRCK